MSSNVTEVKEHVRVSTFLCPPYNFWAYYKNCAYDSRDESNCKDLPNGIEAMMFPLLTSILGMTFNFCHPQLNQETDNMFDTTLRLTENGTTDISVCGLWLTQKRLEILEPVVFWSTVCITFLVPKPRIKIRSWKKVFRPFSPLIWFMITCSILFVSFLTFGIENFHQKYDKKHKKPNRSKIHYTDSVLSAWGITLGVVLPENKPNPTLLRVVLVWWAFFGVNIGCWYSSKLFPVLTFTQYEAEINTIEDLVRNNFTWGARYSFEMADIVDLHSEEGKIFASRFHIANSLTEQNKKIKTNHYAIPIILTHQFYSEILGTPIPSKFLKKLRIMKGCQSLKYVAMYFKKKSPLILPFRRALLRIYESGLNIKMMNTVRERSKNVSVLEPTEMRKVNPSKSMGMATLHGAFYALAVGWVIASAALVVEKLVFAHHQSKMII